MESLLKQMTATNNTIDTLAPNEVFVFGSNMAGAHGGGAALTALKKFGAVGGIGEGLVSQCYAFPTLNVDYTKRSEDELVLSTMILRATAESLTAVTFYLTKVGCGIAGFDEDYMKMFFTDMPPNVVKPEGW